MEPDFDALLEIERMRLAWDFACKEIDLHRQRNLQLFTLFATLCLTGFASVLLERVPPVSGALFALSMAASAACAHLRLRRLSFLLRQAFHEGRATIDS